MKKRILSILFLIIFILSLSSMISTTATEVPKENEKLSPEEGIYYIENLMFDPASREHYILDVIDASKEEDAPLFVNSKEQKDNQKFEIKLIDKEKGIYSITNVNSKLSLYYKDNILCQGKTQGAFTFEKYNDDWMYIRIADSNEYVKVDDTQHMAVRKIFKSEIQDSLYLKWKLVKESENQNNNNSTMITNQESTSNNAQNNNNYTWIIICGAALIILVIVVIVVLIKKSNK